VDLGRALGERVVIRFSREGVIIIGAK